MNRQFKKFLALACLAAISAPQSLLACATCYGASDSPLAQGMNWGIFTLLCVIGFVLSGIASFFVYVGVKSSRLANQLDAQPATESNS